MTNYQILLVINVLLLGVAILSMHFLARSRKQARQVQIVLEDTRRELGEALSRIDVYHEEARQSQIDLNDTRKKLGDVRREVNDYCEKTRQAQIDLENTRKKLDAAEDEVEHYSEQARFVQEAYEDCQKEVKNCCDQIQEERNKELVKFAKKIFPILDKIERSSRDLHPDDESSSVHSRDSDISKKNMAQYYEEFVQAMDISGFQVVNPKGEPFDRKAHEIIGKEVKDGIDSGIVLSVYRKGWMFDGKTVRFAKVVISK